jgi:hypothetical protein
LVIGSVVAFHLCYLTWRCPIDLAEDECYYWDWSRQLDLSYYSKGPATALLIRGSCKIFGDTMQAVRYPAVFLRAGVAIMTYWLALRLFKSDLLALMATILGYITPMFLAAGLIMTTDPAYLFCWAAATCLAVKAIFDERKWAWIGIGMIVGIGTLTKFSMPLWMAGLFLFLMTARPFRQHLRTPWPWVALGIAALWMTPVIIWNSHRGWVTFLHVGEDVGARAGKFHPSNLLDFWAGQLGVIGPMFVVVMAAVVSALVRDSREENWPRRFLLCIGLPIFMAVLICSFRANPAANWTAAAYVTFFILTADFLLRKMSDLRQWRLWRVLFYACATAGLGVIVIAHYTESLYPLVSAINRHRARPIVIAKFDPTAKVKGWAEAGQILSDRRELMGSDCMVMAGDYQVTAELAFYMRGRPTAYCAGSYFTGPVREPYNQYDVWRNRRLDQAELRGRDVLYVGALNRDLWRAFDRVVQLEPVEVSRNGAVVRRLECWACYGFRGLVWPGWDGRYNK